MFGTRDCAMRKRKKGEKVKHGFTLTLDEHVWLGSPVTAERTMAFFHGHHAYRNRLQQRLEKKKDFPVNGRLISRTEKNKQNER